MNFAIPFVLVVLGPGFPVAGAAEKGEGVQIGPPVVASSTETRRILLDRKITLRMTKVGLRSFFEEVGRQAKLQFIITAGFEKCTVTAFLRDRTTREALQAALEVPGITYQQIGRNDTYIIAPRGNVQVCPRASTPPPVGSCDIAQGKPISLVCKGGPLHAYAAMVFEQSRESFFFPDGAEDFSITARLSGVDAAVAVKGIEKVKGIAVERQKGSGIYIIKSMQR